MKRRASMGAIALGMVVLLALGGIARAENECGAPEPGVEIVCAASNYDPSDGNIFYGPDEANADFTIRLADDLALDYDRENPGDDFYIVPDDPENPRHSAVWITPGESAYTGDISVFSSADVTSNARGISVGHYGHSGALRMVLTGAAFTTKGEYALAIHSYHAGAGNIDIIARNLTVNTDGPLADAFISSHAGEGDINIDVRGGTFAATGFRADGIHAQHLGEEGNVNINVQNSNITTMGDLAFGILGFHRGQGNVNVGARRLTVDAMGDLTDALLAIHTGEGGVNIDVRDVAFTVTGDTSQGILALHEGEKGDINVDAQGLTVTVNGEETIGVYVHHHQEGDSNVNLREVDIVARGSDTDGIRAEHRGEGDVNAEVQGGHITATGENAFGIIGFHRGQGNVNVGAQDLTITSSSDGILGLHAGTGDVDIDVRGGSITTMDRRSEGIHGLHSGTGHVTINVRDVIITTESTDLDSDSGDTSSHGVYGDHRGAVGDVTLDVRGGGITTRGVNSYGVYARHSNPLDADDNPLTDSDNTVIQGAGDIAIGTTGGEISTQGNGSHGIYVEHESGMGAISIAVDGGTIHASGVGSSGIRIGRLSEDGLVLGAAALGGDGYRRQSVTVNGRVWGGTGEAAGVYLAGGGRVMIGPQGSLGAESGVAIRSTGDALDFAGATRNPKLYLDANLAGRRMARVIHGDVQNDGGETTIVVNGVKLYDAAAGATGLEVLNGAWDLTLRGREPIGTRAFSAKDFIETLAPRAAVYEALPGLLLRLNSRGPAGERLTAPGSPAWVRISGGAGRYTPVQASVGAKYDFRRIEVEAGLDVALGPRLTGTLSVRHVQGSGDVSSPTGGGKITARGLGGAAGVAWTGPRGYYFRGRVSVMDYDVDLTSDRRGTLIKDASGVGHSLGFETGRRFTLSERLKLTPRVWVTRSKIDLGFTDAVQSRLWATDSDRLTGGTGVVAETERAWDDGAQAFAGAVSRSAARWPRAARGRATRNTPASSTSESGSRVSFSIKETGAASAHAPPSFLRRLPVDLFG